MAKFQVISYAHHVIFNHSSLSDFIFQAQLSWCKEQCSNVRFDNKPLLKLSDQGVYRVCQGYSVYLLSKGRGHGSAAKEPHDRSHPWRVVVKKR